MRGKLLLVVILAALFGSVQATMITGSSVINNYGDEGVWITFAGNQNSRLTHAQISLSPNGFASIPPFSSTCRIPIDPYDDLTIASSLILNGPPVSTFTLDFTGFNSEDVAVYCANIAPDPSGVNTIAVTIDGCVFTGTYSPNDGWAATFGGECTAIPPYCITDNDCPAGWVCTSSDGVCRQAPPSSVPEFPTVAVPIMVLGALAVAILIVKKKM
ncbi:MAG: hypothetical protein LUO97_03590 [Methanomicrobiales archaeon]|nr:hypothetical protein [Methanomicrobiales archaeon]